MLIAAVVALLAVSVNASSEDYIIEEEFANVTCGSGIKLQHKSTSFRLHSHAIAYGTGSQQNSVTGFPKGDDPNSVFVVHEAFGEKPCKRGTPFRCGSTIRLKHLETKRFLHSHMHESPLSKQQEVSCFSDTTSDGGDNWKVICLASGDTTWKREKDIRLQHVDTGKYICSSKSFQFRHPIPGQLEVAASVKANGDTVWTVQEGIFFSSESN
ncbi:hypothetical protein SeMB42_g01143 [Synchytrium endobioticum]|uniref:MIR domain-containing protein n=1 Tax=Synchytrium endobioticum TaxID=286115 RepID=A0A507DMC0_9FUNG|nr:hypothetical protein SeLEV6574_g03562 [Synchytrium endobioticum]TPX52814.1 hypothetical protein SeMB42_g01143 [Synchytrium endobioticum]